MTTNKMKNIILRCFFCTFFFIPSYMEGAVNWREPLCIDIETGLAGPRYIETNLPLNEVVPPQVIEFKLRCRADVKSRIVTTNAGAQIHGFVSRLNQYAPTEALYNITTTATNLGNGETTKSLSKVFSPGEGYPGPVISLPILGPGKHHEIAVKVALSEKIFKAGIIPENPKPVLPLHMPLISVAIGRDDPIQGYALYPIFLVTTFDEFPDPCVTPGPNVYVPSDVNFGTLNREDLDKGVKKVLFFRVARPAFDTCSYSLYPIITFKSTDLVVNDDIQLPNGTELSFILEDFSSGSTTSPEKLKLNIPLRFSELKPSGLLNLRLTANLKKSSNRPLKGGFFSTVLIYHIEYR